MACCRAVTFHEPHLLISSNSLPSAPCFCFSYRLTVPPVSIQIRLMAEEALLTRNNVSDQHSIRSSEGTLPRWAGDDLLRSLRAWSNINDLLSQFDCGNLSESLPSAADAAKTSPPSDKQPSLTDDCSFASNPSMLHDALSDAVESSSRLVALFNSSELPVSEDRKEDHLPGSSVPDTVSTSHIGHSA